MYTKYLIKPAFKYQLTNHANKVPGKVCWTGNKHTHASLITVKSTNEIFMYILMSIYDLIACLWEPALPIYIIDRPISNRANRQ